MRKISTLTIFILLVISSFARQIDEITAKKVGYAFLKTKTKATVASIETLQLVYKSLGKRIFQTDDYNSNVYFYIFNSKNGFVIVSGDDLAIPVLGYSNEKKFDTSNIPLNLLKWFEGYKDAIRYVIEKKISSTKENTEQWQNLINYAPIQNSNQTLGTVTLGTGTAIVAPLVRTHWNQSPYYNALCPYDYETNQRTVTGCVATAMAQIIKYWNFPNKSYNWHSYNHPKYGTISANFGATNYNWNLMPNELTSLSTVNQIYEVGTLIYNCGVSVSMNYGTNSSNAYVISSASPLVHCSEYALKTYFGYTSSLKGIQKINYTTSQWIELLKNEFILGRPVLYAGFGQGGHCFVADGYDSNDFIHFNWGWGGEGPDDYFSVTAINPPILGTGGGNGGGYNDGQQAIIGIQPPTSVPTYDLKLNNYVTPSASTIVYNQPFSISTNIINSGVGSFSGEYCAAIFDNNGTFVGYAEVKTGQTLQYGYTYTNNLVFSNSGMPAMMPGSYSVRIYQRPTNGQWSLVSNNVSYTNFLTINVTYNNAIALNSVITPTPSTFIKGQSASVNLNIENTGSTTFVGKYYTALYNLDGSFAQVIDSTAENNGLHPNYTYSSPYLSFYTPSINVNAGTYLLAALHAPTGGKLQLTGANTFQNPRKVIVKNANIKPDIYEVNNTASQATNLSISFTGNAAYKNTTGSNCHDGNDYDYYKITLPAGSNYQIKPRLQDSYNSNNGNSYSLDGLFAYSFDSTNWSQAFDDTLITNISLNNGGTIYFIVTPYFSGNVGTYLLEMNIIKSAITPVALTSFTAEVKNKFVQLSWSTSNETNASHYNIERSFNGLDFTKIGSVDAVGNTNNISNYHFFDSMPGGINYYRLKQIDNDGLYKYSEIKSVILVTNKSFSVFPNPTKQFVTISGLNIKEVQITDINGKKVYRKTDNFAQTFKVDLTKLTQGIYFILCIDEQGKQKTEKIILE